jgi:hypothetical protein
MLTIPVKGTEEAPSCTVCCPTSSACSKAERRKVTARAAGAVPLPPVLAPACCLSAGTTRLPGLSEADGPERVRDQGVRPEDMDHVEREVGDDQPAQEEEETDKAG